MVFCFTRKRIAAATFGLALLAPFGACATEFVVLHDFDGHDGAFPYGTLIRDGDGNRYGTTGGGGNRRGDGTVYQLAPDGTETVLLRFSNRYEGDGPNAGVIADKLGNLYGTTNYGGYGNGKNCGVRYAGCGNVFKLAPDGTETMLYSFAGGADGAFPSGLIGDKQDHLYGTTSDGGNYSCTYGCGTVFRLASNGTKTILHSFVGTEGGYPSGGLIADKKGNLFGMTASYGEYSHGMIFELSPDLSLTVLYSFQGGNDGASPSGKLIADDLGNLYGTTAAGGGSGCNELGCGTVFKLSPDGTEAVLYSFTGGSDGNWPRSGVIEDGDGTLYGTTVFGGDTSCYSPNGCGTVFELSSGGVETVLHAFTGATDGAWPYAGLIADRRGTLYGAAAQGNGTGCGGYGCGSVFKLKK